MQTRPWLARRLARVGEGEGGAVIITGEAGLGKSRLVAEARRQAERDGLAWLEGHTLAFGRTLAYWPFIELIQQDAGIESDDPEAERWAKLAGRTTALFAEETPTALPYLAMLLSLLVPEELSGVVRYLDAEALSRHLRRAVRLLFARLAKERPTVVVLEDVHWLDGSSTSLLVHLLPLAREAHSPDTCWLSTRWTKRTLGSSCTILPSSPAISAIIRFTRTHSSSPAWLTGPGGGWPVCGRPNDLY